jgi:hypothetical protein
LSEPEPSEPEPHRVTAPAPTKRCGSLRLRLRNTGFNMCLNFSLFLKFCLATVYSRVGAGARVGAAEARAASKFLPRAGAAKNDVAPQHCF